LRNSLAGRNLLLLQSKSPRLAEIAMKSVLRVWPQAFGIALGLLLAVYVPPFALAAVLRLRIEHVVPLVIVVSAALAYDCERTGVFPDWTFLRCDCGDTGQPDASSKA